MTESDRKHAMEKLIEAQRSLSDAMRCLHRGGHGFEVKADLSGAVAYIDGARDIMTAPVTELGARR